MKTIDLERKKGHAYGVIPEEQWENIIGSQLSILSNCSNDFWPMSEEVVKATKKL